MQLVLYKWLDFLKVELILSKLVVNKIYFEVNLLILIKQFQ
jgi:hypothetical protein